MSCLHIFYKNDNEYEYEMDSFSYSYSLSMLTLSNQSTSAVLDNQSMRECYWLGQKVGKEVNIFLI